LSPPLAGTVHTAVFINPSSSSKKKAGDRKPMTQTVHLLMYGAPLCGFMPGCVPGIWPPGHCWVGIDDDENAQEINCAGCIEVREWHQRRKEIRQ
jgi:hypothetical protein